MIKTKKKLTQREKPNTNPNPNQQKISQQKSKNLNDKKYSLSKPKLQPLKTSKNLTESKFHNKKNHNSISSKEEVGSKFPSKKSMKTKPKFVYNNTCGNNNSNNNKLFSSNLFLTNDTDIPIPDEDKKNLGKNILGKNYDNNNNKDEILNLPELENMFKQNRFKKTIIIDDEGNNNLHLNIKKGENDYKNLLNNNNSNSLFLSSSINANTETNSLFTNGSKMEISNIKNNFNNNYIINENEIKNNIIDDNLKTEKNEEKRIEEYTKIFNLLNTNIEQFKKMFNNNANNETNNNINNNKSSHPKEKEKNSIQIKKKQIFPKRNKKILIKKKKQPNQSKKVVNFNIKNNTKKNMNEKTLTKESPKNLIKNLSEKNLSSSSKRIKLNQNIFTVDVRNDIEKDLNSDSKMVKSESNNVISSFLESSIQDDFYQSLMNDYSNIYDEDKILKDDIISVNIDEKGKDENIQDVQNSRIFIGKKENINILKDDKGNKKDEKEKSEDKNNCFIF